MTVFPDSFSIVVDQADKKVRTMPTMWILKVRAFVHRTVDEVLDNVRRTIAAVKAGVHEPVYCVTACEVNGKRGLYARDFFNRSRLRRNLVKRGLRFSSDPFVRLSPTGWRCDDWGEFHPEFALFFVPFEDVSRTVRAGEAAFNILGNRLGLPQPDELGLLRRDMSSIQRLATVDLDALFAALEE